MECHNLLTYGPIQNELGHTDYGVFFVQLLHGSSIGIFSAGWNGKHFLSDPQLLHRFVLLSRHNNSFQVRRL